MRINPELIREIKSRLDIVEIASRFVEVKQRGNRWVCLCPFHHETKPSFYLNRDLGLYYCFGCQASGDTIDLFCKLKGLDFIEGVKELAEELGLGLFSEKSFKSNRITKKDYLKVNLIAYNYFKENLKKSKIALEYLKKRAITSDLVERFGIGFAPNSWEGLKRHLLRSGISEDLALEAGLLSRKGNKSFDRFRNRLMFPIMDIGGDVVAFGGRALGEEDPKYLNTGETPYFKKGHILYGIFQGKKEISSKKKVIITEGYIDLITLFQYGFENSCAVLGTALTEDHVKKLASLCNTAYLVFDGDSAGKRASFRSAEMMLAEGLEVKVVLLPEGEDIDSFLKKKGKEEFIRLLELALDGIDFCVKMLENSSPKSLMGWCVSFLKKVDDFSLKAYYLPKLSQRLNISEDFLRRAIDTGGFSKKPYKGKVDSSENLLPLRDKEFLSFAISYPEFVKRLEKEGIEKILESDISRSLWRKIVAYGQDNILDYLDTNESSVYIKLAVIPRKVSDPDRLCNELLQRVREIQKVKIRSELKKKIEEAEKAKNFNKLKKLLKEFQQL